MLHFLFFVATWFALTTSEKMRGTINLGHDNGLSFLGKFCFGYTRTLSEVAGLVTINIANNKINDKNEYTLLMYDDQPNSWSAIYNTDKTCTEKITGGYARLTKIINFNNSKETNANSYFERIEIHEHVRPRWWWVYLADCSTNVTFKDMNFDLHFEQANNSAWTIEFGMNDMNLNTLYFVYLILYIALVIAQVYAYYVYRIQQYIHQVIKLLTATIVLQMFSILFDFIDWMIFMETGEHELFFPIISGLCKIFASSVFLMLLLVLAQGWTISRFKVLFPRVLLLGVVVVCITQCVLYIWRLIGLDTEETVYFYNSVPMYVYGICMILVGIVFIVWCVWSYLRETMANKRNLYCALAAFFSIWFLWFLLRIFVGDAFSEWSRDIAITAISVTINTLTYLVMVLLLWPTWAHQYFNLSMADAQKATLLIDDEITIDGTNVTAGVDGTLDYQVLDHERL